MSGVPPQGAAYAFILALMRRRFIQALRARREALGNRNLMRALRALVQEEIEEQIEQGSAVGEGSL